MMKKEKKIKINIKYKSVLTGYKNIEERNKAFHSLSDEGKRLEIAWDALNLIVDSKLTATSPQQYDYWDNTLLLVKARSAKEFQSKLLNHLPHCKVCERGLIMVSTIRLGNKINPTDEYRYDGCERNIQGFSMESMHKMESEYEQRSYKHPYKSNTAEKMVNILCNVLVNGDFNTEDKTDYLIH